MAIHQFLGLLLIFSSVRPLTAFPAEEKFAEELLLRPLPDGKVLTQFRFTNELPPTTLYGRHHRLFPKAIYQLVQKFKIQEMEISFTQGRWNYERWGAVDPVAAVNAKPSGVEMWASFAVPLTEIDSTWGNLTHALSGLFCASLNFLELPTMIANPIHTFGLNGRSSNTGHENTDCNVEMTCQEPKNYQLEAPKHVRYGALPREAVCTENLTPWLKLLPCRDKAGLASLLDRPTLYKSWYHSLRLYLKCNEFEPQLSSMPTGTFLEQTLTVVTEPLDMRSGAHVGMQPSWSLRSLFGKHLSSGCPLAGSSNLYLELDEVIAEKLTHCGIEKDWMEEIQNCNINDIIEGTFEPDDVRAGLGCKGRIIDTQKQLKAFTENELYTFHGVPQTLFWGSRSAKGIAEQSSVLLVLSIPRHVGAHLLDIGMTWKVPFIWAPARGPFRATRFMMGSGNARGSIAIVLRSNDLHSRKLMEASGRTDKTLLQSSVADVTIFQVVPWYIRLYLHTMKVLVDDQPMPFQEVVKWMQVFPSEDRRSPGVIELELSIPSNASTVAVVTDFDKGFLRIDEHPPDANRGFDLPSALISFPNEECERHYWHGGPHTIDFQYIPLIEDFKRRRSMQIYTEVLLIPLATPDFSMPYNVITLTCTVLALYFGSLLNVLRRRIGEEERLANLKNGPPVGKLEQFLSKFLFLRRNENSQSHKLLKIFKFVLVAAIGIMIHYYLNSS